MPLVSAEIKCAGRRRARRRSCCRRSATCANTDAAADGQQVWRDPGLPARRIWQDHLRHSRRAAARAFALDNARPGSWAMPARAATTGLRRAPRRCAVSPTTSRRSRLPNAWRSSRTNGRWRERCAHDIGVFLDLAGGFRQERTRTVLQTLTRSARHDWRRRGRSSGAAEVPRLDVPAADPGA